MKTLNKILLSLLAMFVFFSVQSCIVVDNSDVYADFTTEKTTYSVDEKIFFENLSEHADEFSWDFDDGYKSSLRNPEHSFAKPGVYTVELKAFNGAYSDHRRQKITVE